MSIPSYSNPCIISTSTTSTPSSIIYLIGVSDTTQGLLEVNAVDLSNLSNPLSTLSIASSNPFQWSNTAPKICSTYPGYQPAKSSPFNGVIHIQQFGVGWSNDANVFPNIGKIEQPSQFDEMAYPDPKLFATVGNAGLSQFVLTMTNTTNNWVGVRCNATDSTTSLYNPNLNTLPVNTPFLAVGTYTATARAPARGNAIVFGSTRSGTIFNATGSDTVNINSAASPLTLSAPQAVAMGDVTFTMDAIPFTSGAGAYILDKAYDGTTAIYYINPSQSTTLQRVAVSGPAPTFIKTMVGTVTPTQIILYSVQTGGPQFNIFDLTSKAWTVSPLITPGNPPINGTLTPGDTGVDGSSGSKVSPGGIVGGVLAAIAFIALAGLFVIRRHRHRRPSSTSSSSSSTHSYGGNGESELAPLYTVAAVQDDSYTVAMPVDAPYPPPPTFSSSTVSYPLPPRNSVPRDPQLTPAKDPFHPPPLLGANALRNPQSPIWKSLAFDFIPKTPPGPELHYSESWGDYADTDSKHHSKDVHSTFGGNHPSQEGLGHAKAEARSICMDDPYDKRPFTPSRLSSDTVPAVGAPQLHDRNLEQVQGPEQSCSSPLVSEAATLPTSELDAPNVPIPASDPIDSKQDNTAFFLIGVTDTAGPPRLEINAVDLTYIDTPSVRLLRSEVDPKRWSPSAPKLCSNYPGAITTTVNKPGGGVGRVVNPRIHVQQFSRAWTFDINAVPGYATGGGTGAGGEGSAEFEKPKKGNGDNGAGPKVSFLSPRRFAIVAQAGESMYGVGMTDSVDQRVGSSWRGLVVDATENVDSFVSGPSQYNPSETTLLALGTFTTTTPLTPPPALGHLTTFDSSGTSGQIFPTVSGDNRVQIQQPHPVQMNNITLSSNAIPVHQSSTGFILDQARDGTTIVYTITPGTSSDLASIPPSPTSYVPRFSEFMVATSTDSQIIIYSVFEGNPRFNIFDVSLRVWSGPALVAQSGVSSGGGGSGSGIPTTSFPGGQGSGSISEIGGSTSGGKGTSGVVIGGAVAGGLILMVLAAFFIVRSRKQRASHPGRRREKSPAQGLGREQNGGEEERLTLSENLSASRQTGAAFHPFTSAGSFATINTTVSSSSAVPLMYMPPPPQTPRPSSTPPTSLPLLLAQRPPLSQSQRPHQQQQQQQQHQHAAQQPYNAVRSFSDSTVYQSQLVRKTTFVQGMDATMPSQVQAGHSDTNTDSNTNGDREADEQEPYTLPAPIIVAPTPLPHKAELID